MSIAVTSYKQAQPEHEESVQVPEFELGFENPAGLEDLVP
jgi:hypothetical protein